VKTKNYSYHEIFAPATMDEKAEKFIEFLSRDDVDPRNANDVEKIFNALYPFKGVRIHIAVGETLVKTIDNIIINSIANDGEKLNKYLTALNKLSLFFIDYAHMYLEQLIDEIKRVVSEETVQVIIDSITEECRLILIKKLIEVPYWRQALPKLELYDTFS
jgi:hypothetical protein